MKQSNMQERISHLCSHLCCWLLRGLPSAAKKHPWVDEWVILRSSPPPLTSCPCVRPQSHKHIKSLSLIAEAMLAISVFFFCQRSRSNMCTKTKCLSEEATSLISGHQIKGRSAALTLVLLAAWRLTSSKALHYFWR